MDYKIQDLIDIKLFQELLDRLNEAFGFATAIVDNDSNVLTASGWQDICTKFHRVNELSELECKKSDQYIKSHMNEANPAVSYKCPHGMVDNAIPIIIEGKHLANFFIGQLFLDKPNIDFFINQAKKYGFDETKYLEAVSKVPFLTEDQLQKNLKFVKSMAEILAQIGLDRLDEIEIMNTLINNEKKYEQELENTNKKLQQINCVLKNEVNEKEKALGKLQKYKLLSEKANDAMLFIDKDGKILDANAAAIRNYGYTSEEFVSLSIFHLRRSEKRSNIIEQMEVADKDGIVFETIHYRKDGTPINVEVSAQGAFINNKRVLVSIVRDISERKKAEQEIIYLNYHDHLTGLYNLRYYEEKISKLDNEKFVPLTLAIFDINGLKLTNDVFGHKSGDLLLKKVTEVFKSVCRADDIVARIGGDEFILILPKTDAGDADAIVKRINSAIANEKIDNIILSISCGYATKKYNYEDIEDIFIKADDQMYKNKLFESPNMKKRTIELIVNSLYKKDDKYELHSKKVSDICIAIATKMNLNIEAIEKLRIAGLMHDIGNIGLDEKVINKPKKIDKDERIEIQRHSEIGYRILSSLNEFSDIATYVLDHHERWDGNGYPRGLKGEEISLQARIIAIADSFVAMTTHRIYRKALSDQEAIDEIEKCSGSQFDPKIVSVFLKIYKL